MPSPAQPSTFRWRIRPIIAAILFGVAMNYVAAWFCVQRHRAEEDAIWTTAQLSGFGAGWLRPAFHRTSSLGAMPWPIHVPSDWPAQPLNVIVTEYSWIQERNAIACTPETEGKAVIWPTSRTDAGWPLRSVWKANTWISTRIDGTWTWQAPGEQAAAPIPSSWRLCLHMADLPLGILPLPFLANTAIYALAAWLVLISPGALKRRRRSRLHLCPICAYPIGTSPLCTECGHPVQPIPPTAQPT